MGTGTEGPGQGEDYWDTGGQVIPANFSADFPVDAPSSPRAADRFAADTHWNTNESTPPMKDDDTYWEHFPETLTAADLSKILSIGRPAVLTRLKSGMIPGHLIVGSWVIFKAEVRVWLDSTSNQAPTGPPVEVDVLANYENEMSYRDLMVIMGKTKRTIYSWLNSGEIPAFHAGTRWIIHKTQLREKLESTSNQNPARQL